MRNFLKTVCLLLLLFVLVSCATVEKTPITGKWVAKTEFGECAYLFSPDGKFAFEDSYNDNYNFGSYEYLDGKLICNNEEFTVVLKGNRLIVEGVKYKKASSKVVNNSSSISGVWQMEDSESNIILGFTNDGSVLCSGTYYNCGSYSIDPSKNLLNVKMGYDYLILNDTLYVDLFTFASFYKVEKLSRLTDEGLNMSLDKLVSINGWWYLEKDSNGLSGTQYYFYDNGSYWAMELDNAVVQKNYGGSYTFEYPNTVNLSSGESLIFCVIDNYPFGYTI